MKELDKVLDKNEKIFWEGAPKFWPFIFSGSGFLFIFGLIWMTFLIPFFSMFYFISSSLNSTGFFWSLFFTPHFWIGIILVIGVPLYQILVYRHMHYAITNKRVIFQKGLIGRDFEIIDFDQITNAEVNVGIFDKLFMGNTGTILISSAGTLTYTREGAVAKPYMMRNVENPYDVFKFFKKVSHDVKTDIQYPNKYRPRTNPGYKTSYRVKR